MCTFSIEDANFQLWSAKITLGADPRCERRLPPSDAGGLEVRRDGALEAGGEAGHLQRDRRVSLVPRTRATAFFPAPEMP